MAKPLEAVKQMHKVKGSLDVCGAEGTLLHAIRNTHEAMH